ncbi:MULTISPECIES: UDP-3-O-(3-hydroxymyristoyl)glucosamine N-acyltransferase [Rhodopseudomonas]|uniref:UDP-3-O-(3-hydroxymyristoyl)glucosamine N-acyltransferase n=1 Tax=Rhodopseudomonas TaxID=1073 RepID=UPI0009B97864|nr:MULTISPECIES: UDP-3-O-(3-hydroxymyristoyl)glucosamine N-acyltransferase [Rhodopseudomonas]MDF3809180.1 UDP-3-O-(3-hydroxymyristoyl)glucosamine N-acyltransferase [Rhodopseudomonas sp. BAL398]WOK19132.1 UDP-3-O-(3-hydroxymyristoyl)glucosamine N-acyltransferase [Rhodopseudomonas sp. BAL398]
MAQPSFLKPPPPMSLADLAKIAGAHLIDASRGGQRITGLASLDEAGPIHLTFFDNAKYAAQLAATLAGACLVNERFEAAVPPHVAVLRVADPLLAFVTVAGELYRERLSPQSWFGIVGIAASAVVDPTARLEDGVAIDPLAVVGPGVEIGADSVIGSGVIIGANVRIGRGCRIGPACTVQSALIGNNVVLQPGCHIGQDGYGFAFAPEVAARLPHLGRVLIQNDVEIGAGATIERGSMRDTVIGEGSKIDSQVRIGHDAAIGRLCRLGAQASLAGSTTLGDGVELGAASQIRSHVRIGDGAKVVPARIIDEDIAADQPLPQGAVAARSNPAGKESN